MVHDADDFDSHSRRQPPHGYRNDRTQFRIEKCNETGVQTGRRTSKTLNDSEKELLEKLEDSYAEAIQSDSQQSFINGFRLGALVIVEVFAGRDGLVLGNVEG